MKTIYKILISMLSSCILTIIMLYAIHRAQEFMDFWDYVVIIVMAIPFGVLFMLGVDMIVEAHKDEKLKKQSKFNKTWKNDN